MERIKTEEVSLKRARSNEAQERFEEDKSAWNAEREVLLKKIDYLERHAKVTNEYLEKGRKQLVELTKLKDNIQKEGQQKDEKLVVIEKQLQLVLMDRSTKERELDEMAERVGRRDHEIKMMKTDNEADQEYIKQLREDLDKAERVSNQFDFIFSLL